MPSSHLFTENDQIKVDLVPPPGATAVIIRATVQKGPEPPAGETVRLFHLRLAKPGAPVRDTQILELIYRDGSYTAGFSGFGGGAKAMANPANKKRLLPVHMGRVAASAFPVVLTVPFSGEGVIVGMGGEGGGKTAVSPTELAPAGQPMELLLGFQGEGDLRAPAGWTIAWEDNAVEWVDANPVTPPSTPPVPPSPPIVTPPAPPAPLPGSDWKAELRHDLQQLITKYAAAAGVDPTLLFGLQLLLGMVNR